MFNLNRDNGLTSYLVGLEKDYKKIINHTDVENLSVITSGVIPPNPSELISSSALEELLEKLKDDYDAILFDTPPLIAVTDAYIISKHVNNFLLVIRSAVTQKGALERALTQANNINNNIYGVIFNGVNEFNTYGGGYYYNYYQYYADEK